MKKKSILLSAFAVIAICASLICGTTYALFTSENQTDIAVTSGKVSVSASIQNLLTKQLNDVEYTKETHTLSGAASVVGNSLSLENFAAGDGAKFDIAVANAGTISTKYRVIMSTNLGDGVSKVKALSLGRLNITIDGKPAVGYKIVSDWMDLTENVTIPVTVELDRNAGSESQETSITLYFTVEAVQANGASAEAHVIKTAEDLLAFSRDVNSGNDYENQIVTLANDIDMTGVDGMLPIGTSEHMFKGIFDGNGHTIKNLTIHATTLDGVGLFGYVNGNAVIRDLVLDHADISGAEYVAAAVGKLMVSGNISKVQSMVYNVSVLNSTVLGGHFVGTIAGHSYGIIRNCHVNGCNVKAVPRYVSFDKLDDGDKVGGLVGLQQDVSLIGNVVENTTVEAVRDVAALVGHIALTNNNVFVAEFSENTVKNVVVNHAKYEGLDKDLNKGDICGRKPTGVCKDGGVQNTIYYGMTFADIYDQYRQHNNVVENVTYGQVDPSEIDQNTIYIADLTQFETFAKEVNEGKNFSGKTVVLLTNLDLAKYVSWTPIGTPSSYFKGTFDGNGHVIKNLTVVGELGDKGGENLGLFGYIAKPAVLKNFTVENANITGYRRVGAVVGNMYTGTVENVAVKDVTITTNRHAGGITGYSYGTIKNCSAENVTIQAIPNDYLDSEGILHNDIVDNGDKVGGIVGYAASTYLLNNSVKNVTISAYRDLGGVVGYCGSDGGSNISGNTADVVILSYYKLGEGVSYLQEGTSPAKPNQNMGGISGYVGTPNYDSETNVATNVTMNE